LIFDLFNWKLTFHLDSNHTLGKVHTNFYFSVFFVLEFWASMG